MNGTTTDADNDDEDDYDDAVDVQYVCMVWYGVYGENIKDSNNKNGWEGEKTYQGSIRYRTN